MADPITFKRDGDKITISVDLKAALSGRLKSGRAGASGQANIDLGGRKVRAQLNVYEAGKVSPVVSL